MYVKNTTGESRFLAATQTWVDDGETVEVDDQAGESLVEQGWTAAKAPKAATPTTEAVPADPQED